MRKIISLFTTLSIVFGVLGTFTVFADETAADLEISTLAQLEAFRDDVNSGNTYEGKTVKLTADIDMSEKYGEGKESWTPIDTFAGKFDGGNHTINGLYSYTEEQYGHASLFSFINGTLKNLNVKGTVIANNQYDSSAAGIAGCLDVNAQMINCSFEGFVKNLNYAADGLVETNLGLISGCRFKGKVEGMHLVGGIAGTGEGTIINCTNEGEIIGTAPVGGIAGYCKTIKNCVNKGNVTGRTFTATYTDYNGNEVTESVASAEVGGIVGDAVGGIIENCYNLGSVSGNSEVGGIIGVAPLYYYDTPDNATLLQVKNCYNIGNITSTMENDSEHNIGAVIGSSEYNYTEDGENFTKILTSEAVDCYYLTGTADNGCGGIAEDSATALTTEQFADKTNFTNWDFETVWDMDTTLGRPVLQSNREEPPVHIHTLVHHAAVAATCTENGTGEYWKCEGDNGCNKLFSDENAETEIAEIPVISAKGHTEVTDIAVEPTCETDGKTAGSHCSVCNTVITAQTTISKLNHTWGAWSITTEPTFNTAGKAERICETDNTHKETVDVPVLSDREVWEESLRTEPTEIFDGFCMYISQYGVVSVTIHALTDKHFLIEYANGTAMVQSRDTGTYAVVFAAYDENDVMTSVEFKSITFETAGMQKVTPESFNTNGAKTVKVMLWENLENMKPCCDSDTVISALN